MKVRDFRKIFGKKHDDLEKKLTSQGFKILRPRNKVKEVTMFG